MKNHDYMELMRDLALNSPDIAVRDWYQTELRQYAEILIGLGCPVVSCCPPVVNLPSMWVVPVAGDGPGVSAQFFDSHALSAARQLLGRRY